MLGDRDTSLARGRLVHRLLQSLPDLAPERRPEAAGRHLARTGAAFSESERDEMLVQVLKVIGDPRFGPLFAPGSHAEVPIVGRLAGGKQGLLAVSGQVDRLAVTDKEVLIADYKTDRPAPRRLDDVPPEYRRQLALYRAVLGQIYPGRLIRAALIWTDLPELMEIPAARLDGELAPSAAA
jgi:ATP-dependent helicase/nuclease subunit A